MNEVDGDAGGDVNKEAIDNGISNVVSVLWSISSEPYDKNDSHWDLKNK